MSLGRNLTLAGIAAILVYQLLLPPIVGLADQGDYARVIGHFGYGPTVKEFNDRYYFFLNRTYQRDPTFKTRGWESFTSQYVFLRAAITLNKLISKDGMLDLRVVGFTHLMVFLLAAFFLLRATDRLLPPAARIAISLALLIMFCDIGYISYFNSFFTEPASYLFLLLVLAVWLSMIAREGADLKHVALFGVCGALFATAKPQNSVGGLILAAYVWRFRHYIQAPRWAIPVCSLALFAASLGIYFNTPQSMKQAATYDMMFMTIVPGAPDQAAALRSFGLDPALVKYSGTAAYSPNTAFWFPEFQREFARHVSQFTILSFYLRHPARLAKLIAGVIPRSTSIRAEFSANFEKSAGYPPFTRSRAFAAWSRFRERWLSGWALLSFLAVSLPVSLWLAISARSLRCKLLAECYGVLALLALLAFFTTVMADSLDIVKHLFIFNVLTDICLTFAVASGICWVGGRDWGALKRRLARPALNYVERNRRKLAQANL